MSEKCFCHIKDKEGNRYAVKDATARKALADLDAVITSKLQTIERQIRALDMAIDELDDIGDGDNTIDLTNITNAIANLEGSLTDISDLINTLQHTTNRHGEDIESLSGSLNILNNIIIPLQNTINTLSVDVSRHNSVVNELDEKMSAFEDNFIDRVALEEWKNAVANIITEQGDKISALENNGSSKKYLHRLVIDLSTYSDGSVGGNMDYSKPYGNAVVLILNNDSAPINSYIKLKDNVANIIDCKGVINMSDSPDTIFIVYEISVPNTNGTNPTSYDIKYNYIAPSGYGVSTDVTLSAINSATYSQRLIDTVTEI